MHFPWSIIAFAGRSTARTPVLCWGGFSHLENRVAWEKFSNRLQDPSCETIPPGLGGGFHPPSYRVHRPAWHRHPRVEHPQAAIQGGSYKGKVSAVPKLAIRRASQLPVCPLLSRDFPAPLRCGRAGPPLLRACLCGGGEKALFRAQAAGS